MGIEQSIFSDEMQMPPQEPASHPPTSHHHHHHPRASPNTSSHPDGHHNNNPRLHDKQHPTNRPRVSSQGGNTSSTTLKGIIIGPPGSGKTSLTRRLTGKELLPAVDPAHHSTHDNNNNDNNNKTSPKQRIREAIDAADTVTFPYRITRKNHQLKQIVQVTVSDVNYIPFATDSDDGDYIEEDRVATAAGGEQKEYYDFVILVFDSRKEQLDKDAQIFLSHFRQFFHQHDGDQLPPPMFIALNYRDCLDHDPIEFRQRLDVYLQEDFRGLQQYHIQSCSFHNCFGLQILHRFLLIPYLNYQKQLLLKRYQMLHDEMSLKWDELVGTNNDIDSYSKFLERLPRHRPTQQQPVDRTNEIQHRSTTKEEKNNTLPRESEQQQDLSPVMRSVIHKGSKKTDEEVFESFLASSSDEEDEEEEKSMISDGISDDGRCTQQQDLKKSHGLDENNCHANENPAENLDGVVVSGEDEGSLNSVHHHQSDDDCNEDNQNDNRSYGECDDDRSISYESAAVGADNISTKSFKEEGNDVADVSKYMEASGPVIKRVEEGNDETPIAHTRENDQACISQGIDEQVVVENSVSLNVVGDEEAGVLESFLDSSDEEDEGCTEPQAMVSSAEDYDEQSIQVREEMEADDDQVLHVEKSAATKESIQATDELSTATIHSKEQKLNRAKDDVSLSTSEGYVSEKAESCDGSMKIEPVIPSNEDSHITSDDEVYDVVSASEVIDNSTEQNNCNELLSNSKCDSNASNDQTDNTAVKKNDFTDGCIDQQLEHDGDTYLRKDKSSITVRSVNSSENANKAQPVEIANDEIDASLDSFDADITALEEKLGREVSNDGVLKPYASPSNENTSAVENDNNPEISAVRDTTLNEEANKEVDSMMSDQQKNSSEDDQAIITTTISINGAYDNSEYDAGSIERSLKDKEEDHKENAARIDDVHVVKHHEQALSEDDKSLSVQSSEITVEVTNPSKSMATAYESADNVPSQNSPSVTSEAKLSKNRETQGNQPSISSEAMRAILLAQQALQDQLDAPPPSSNDNAKPKKKNKEEKKDKTEKKKDKKKKHKKEKKKSSKVTLEE